MIGVLELVPEAERLVVVVDVADVADERESFLVDGWVEDPFRNQRSRRRFHNFLQAISFTSGRAKILARV